MMSIIYYIFIIDPVYIFLSTEFVDVFQSYPAGVHSRQSFDKNENKGISQSKVTKSSKLASKIFTVRQYDTTASGASALLAVASICVTEQIFFNLV